ncbi:MAG TPA: class I SAM-dependent methyltransferase [Chitinophagaceae bacterium]
MYNKFTLARKYILYYLTASNGRGHGIHSPFIYQFVRQVLHNRRSYYSYGQIEAIRSLLLNDDTMIEVEDKGAGSAIAATKQRRIREIARTALKPPKYARLLFRMVDHYQPATILELGTSLGITTAYMAIANPSARIITIEGSPAIALKARENFSRLNIRNIQLVTDDFSNSLKPSLEALKPVDLVFVDGNHRKAPTLLYFEEILRYSHPETIIVFDDIHWSAEMEEAWSEIKGHPAVKCTVDLFLLGLVFLKEEFRVPRHFTIRF